MEIQTMYAMRMYPRDPISPAIQAIIESLKISFKPYKRPPHPQRRKTDDSNWREASLLEVHRKVRENSDPDYDAIFRLLNQITKSTRVEKTALILEIVAKKDEMFRLRVTTLLFDRGITQNFFAATMAHVYKDIVQVYPEAASDLRSQMNMFDDLYDMKNVVTVPHSSDPAYDESILAWTKHKERKRCFAVFVSELYERGIVLEETMDRFVQTIAKELEEGVYLDRNNTTEEHVDACVRFLFAVAGKVSSAKQYIAPILAIPRDQAKSLNMKSRFKLDDALKLDRVVP